MSEEVVYTPQRLDEIKTCSNDPKYFINNYCFIDHPKYGVVRYVLRDYEEFKQEMIKLIGEVRWRREYEGEFVTEENTHD